VVAAPSAPFIEPFRSARRRGAFLLFWVASAAVLLAVLLVGRLTRSLEALSAAATAVSRGQLDRTVEESGPAEVAGVARAFNTMTQSLRRTLAELVDGRVQAAAGEFAASLAHEVRNPLTAIRLDLQVVEEGLPDDSPLRPVQERALAEISRLDRTVGEALAAAGARGLGTRIVCLKDPIDAALQASSATFIQRRIPLPEAPQAVEVWVRGEPGALEQLFLNLLLNAAQAARAGGSVRLTVDVDGALVRVTVSDDGPGIPEELRDRIFQPFVSGKVDGTGLGLPVARRIARAHGGEIVFATGSQPGAHAVVTLPLVSPET
jgi:signal transduction histidine kinase